jgi:hypothetical protein
VTMEIQHHMWRIEGIHDAYHAAVYDHRNLDAALSTVEPTGSLLNLPMRTGTSPDRDLRSHLAQDVLPHLPADLVFRRISRTVDQRRLTQESVVSFTHDREPPWLLPGSATHASLRRGDGGVHRPGTASISTRGGDHPDSRPAHPRGPGQPADPART